MLHHATEVGHVAALHRYPVKSMRGEALQTSRVWWHGFEGDRRYTFLRSRAPLNKSLGLNSGNSYGTRSNISRDWLKPTEHLTILS